MHLRTGKEQDMDRLRNAKGQYIPGISGNPGGRTASDISITTLIDKAVNPEDWDFIFKNLLKMARRGNLKAIEILLDRRFGKAIQATEHTGKDGGPIVIVNWDDAR